MIKKKLDVICIASILLFLLFWLIPTDKAYAEEAAAISFGTIDYETLTMQVFSNNNDIVYYSIDDTTWTEMEGSYDAIAKVYTMDISWVSTTADVILYFKGDKATTVKSITLPMKNSSVDVQYDKVEGEFTFSEVDDAEYFEWRKASDYYWNLVNFNENSSTYRVFLDTMETLRTKGAKIIFRTPQVIGTGVGKVGSRPSTAVTITIPARGVAPTVKVNSSKLTMSTTKAMEYYDATTNLWIECDGTTALEDIVPNVLYEKGGITTTLQIRKAATTSSPYSKTQKLTITGQAAAPTIGGNTFDVTYYYLNSKLVLQFNKATKTDVYEYAIVKSSSTFNIKTTGWRSVTASKLMTLSNSTAPSGCTIYVRKKGKDESTSNKVPLVLSSAVNSFTVTY